MTLSAKRSALLIIDMQERLMPAIADGGEVTARAVRLAQAAGLLQVPVVATEQYPKGLGPTVGELAGYPSAVLSKTAFSAVAAPGFAGLLPAGTDEVVIAGVEAHVCVLQTVLDLLDGGSCRVALSADACGSRFGEDKAAALERARQHGAQVVTSEMVAFEWLGDASHPRFRDVQKLLK